MEIVAQQAEFNITYMGGGPHSRGGGCAVGVSGGPLMSSVELVAKVLRGPLGVGDEVYEGGWWDVAAQMSDSIKRDNAMWRGVAHDVPNWSAYYEVDAKTIWEWIQVDLVSRVAWIKTLDDGHVPEGHPGSCLDIRAHFDGISRDVFKTPPSINPEMVVAAALCIKPRVWPAYRELVNPVPSIQVQIDALPVNALNLLRDARMAYVGMRMFQTVPVFETMSTRTKGMRVHAAAGALQSWRWLQVAEAMARLQDVVETSPTGVCVDVCLSRDKGTGKCVSSMGSCITLKKRVCFELVPWMRKGDEDSATPVFKGMKKMFEAAVGGTPSPDRRSASSTGGDPKDRSPPPVSSGGGGGSHRPQPRHPPHEHGSLASGARMSEEVCPLFLAWLQGDMWTVKPSSSAMRLAF